MRQVTIQENTTKNPISLIGFESGTCYGAPTDKQTKNYKRGLENLISGHGRTEEFPSVFLTIEGYSARVMREWYTHIGGAPTRLQASTRYIDYANFEYITPSKIENNDFANKEYAKEMQNIIDTYQKLIDNGIPKEDAANILPLGMTTKVVTKINMRTLITMSHQRLCTRAYWEYRMLMREIMQKLSEYSEEWAYIVAHYFKPKCEVYHFCTEVKSCGKAPKEEELLKLIKKAKECRFCDDDWK